MTVFEETLFALKSGVPAPLVLEKTRFRTCPPAETTEIDQQLERVVSLWHPIKSNITKVLTSEEMSTGKLNTGISTSGLKEIAVLSSSLNRLRISLLTMMERHKKKRLSRPERSKDILNIA